LEPTVVVCSAQLSSLQKHKVFVELVDTASQFTALDDNSIAVILLYHCKA